MKTLVLVLATIVAAPLAATAAEEEMHPPEKAMDKAVPKMKNPEGTEGLHPPQKAMDSAVEQQKLGPGRGANASVSNAASFPDWDKRVAGQTLDLTKSGEASSVN